MGLGSSSPRSVTLEMDESRQYVKVSDEVLNRLSGIEPGSSKTSAVSDEEFSKAVQTALVEEKRRGEREKDNEIRMREEMWTHQLKQNEIKNTEAFNRSITEFHNAVKVTEQKFLQQTYRPICVGLHDNLMKCYLDNPKQTLKCSSLVGAFSDCVEEAKQKILARHKEASQA